MKTKNSIYTMEEKDDKIYVYSPYSHYMRNFFNSINAKWKPPHWVAYKESYDIIVNELTYFFGESEDTAVDLKIDVGTLVIRDRLFIAGLKCIEIDVLEKKFMQTTNLYIYEKYTYRNWQKVNYATDMSKSFFTRLLVSFFRPFKIKNCIFLLSNISKTRAQDFINSNPSWVKNASIVPAKNNKFHK